MSAPQLDAEVAQRLQTTPSSGLIPVIVEGAGLAAPTTNTTRAQTAEARILSYGGHVLGSSSLLGASVAELTPDQVRSLASDPSIGSIHLDADVRATALATDDSTSGATPITFQQTIGANQVWGSGDAGQGVAVAVLDTGIADNPDAFGDRVKARVDLVNPAQPVAGDPAGHGTHVAGIIAAGRSFASPGVAPDASLVSVRVLDQNGSSRVSTVIAGLEWVIAHKDALGIRVVAMALGAPAASSYETDPLAAAAEMAWRSGLVVVVAAGNAGPAASISTPGIDPLVLTVGATDESGTPTTSDDVIPFWSSEGPTVDGLAKPDLVAPGRKIVSVRVPGSALDVALPQHIEGPATFRLSGTSESTGVAAGAAALLVAHRSQLEPDDVKAILTHTTTPLAGASANAEGSGELSVARALNAPVPPRARQTARPADLVVRLLLSIVAQDDVEAQRVNWDRVNWDRVNWDRVNWDRVNWDRVNWDIVNWDRVNWDRVNWDIVNWDRVNWDRVNWDRVNWDRVNWDIVNWD